MWSHQRERVGEEKKNTEGEGADPGTMAVSVIIALVNFQGSLTLEKGQAAIFMWCDPLLILRGEKLAFASKMWQEVRRKYLKTWILVPALPQED